ncbi:HAD family hydrolase [Glaciecola sp. 1036]|uniref:HAD family hydrolase n=1 Tax=Alteromonadaceae TaxID=72275 RepID=UPI003CFDEF3D
MKVYLFDWGDTLMVDFPNGKGKMCDWETVQAVEGAKELLQRLSSDDKIYIATGAAESSESDIKAAFERVGLDRFISGYFCKANLGISKGSPEFLRSILDKLNVTPECVFMVGDSYEKDIVPALAIGIQAIWLSPSTTQAPFDNVRIIKSLREM